MTRDQAKDLALRVAKLFPSSPITAMQIQEIAKEFEKFDADKTELAIKEHHRTCDFLNLPKLYVHCRPTPNFAADEHRRHQAKLEAMAVQQRQREADEACAVIPDERLIELRDEVLSASSEHMRALLSHRNPRESAMLRDLIYAHMESPQRAEAI